MRLKLPPVYGLQQCVDKQLDLGPVSARGLESGSWQRISSEKRHQTLSLIWILSSRNSNELEVKLWTTLAHVAYDRPVAGRVRRWTALYGLWFLDHPMIYSYGSNWRISMDQVRNFKLKKKSKLLPLSNRQARISSEVETKRQDCFDQVQSCWLWKTLSRTWSMLRDSSDFWLSEWLRGWPDKPYCAVEKLLIKNLKNAMRRKRHVSIIKRS